MAILQKFSPPNLSFIAHNFDITPYKFDFQAALKRVAYFKVALSLIY
jgi:hypothetical protein